METATESHELQESKKQMATVSDVTSATDSSSHEMQNLNEAKVTNIQLLPLIQVPKNENEIKKVWKGDTFFADFLTKRHKCSMDKGIKVLKRDKNFGIITEAECQMCKKSFSTVFEGASHYQVRIVKAQNKLGNKSPQFYSLQPEKREKPLEPGDHIAWHRKYAIWHHGIVTDTGVTETKLRRNSKQHCFADCCDGSCCCLHSNDRCQLIDRIKVIEHTRVKGEFVIRKEEYDLYECMDVCRFEYSASYPPEYTVELAKETMKRFEDKKKERKKEELTKETMKRFEENQEKKDYFHELVYDPFGSNCEHFARRCKTGISESGQVKDCLRDCGKGFLMSLWSLVSLGIWFVCELFVNLVITEGRNEKCCNESVNRTDEGRNEKFCNETNSRIYNEKLLLEISISVTLSGLFFIIYCVYSISREISKIRYPFVPDSETGCYERNRGCCYRENYARFWIFWCLVFCRPCYMCYTGCSGCCTCCSKAPDRNCKNCGLCCTNYFNIIIRVFLRELIATAPPVVAFFLFVRPICVGTVSGVYLKAFYGFLASLAVAAVSLPLGAIIGSLVEVLCLGCCLGSCRGCYCCCCACCPEQKGG